MFFPKLTRRSEEGYHHRGGGFYADYKKNHEKVSVPKKKEKREKVKVHKVKARKRAAPVPNKLSQSYLNKLNKKLEEIKTKSKK